MKFAVIINKSIYHEADERSKTNPGHGYPAHTTEHLEFQEFENEEEILRWIERHEKRYSYEKYKVIKFEELKVNREISLTLG